MCRPLEYLQPSRAHSPQTTLLTLVENVICRLKYCAFFNLLRLKKTRQMNNLLSDSQTSSEDTTDNPELTQFILDIVTQPRVETAASAEPSSACLLVAAGDKDAHIIAAIKAELGETSWMTKLQISSTL